MALNSQGSCVVGARRALRVSATVPLLALLSGCGSGISFLDPHGPVAAAQRDLFFEVTAWMMIVVLPAIVLVPLVAWRYRRRATRSAYKPDWHFSWPIEIAVWGVPFVLVGILATLIVGKARSLDPYAAIPSDQPPLEIEVIGLDYKWLFVYPAENVASIGVMALPVDRPVHFRLTSDTVMQFFMIPALTLLWQVEIDGVCEELLTVRAAQWRRLREEVEDRLPDGWHARLWRRAPDSFFSVPLP